MRNANLIACNTAGVITSASLQYDDYDEGEVVQLTIGDFQYKFNNEGKLITTVPNPQGVCANNNNNNNNNYRASCASFPEKGTCIPTNFKIED